MYVQPTGGGAKCSVGIAPLLQTGVRVDPPSSVDPNATQRTIVLGPQKEISGTIQIPEGTGGLDGWTLDLIEPSLGRVISTTAALGAVNPTNFQITYRPVQTTADNNSLGSDAPGVTAPSDTPFIRVSPPKNNGGPLPTAFWSLAVDLDGDGIVNLNMSSLVNQVSHIRGRIESADRQAPVPSTVTFTSVSLNGVSEGLTASYATNVKSDSDGTFAVDLVSGTYSVVAAPEPISGFAVTQTTWIVANDQIAGASPVVLAVAPKTRVSGHAEAAANGAPLIASSIQAVPVVPAASIGVLHAILAQDPPSTRAGNVVADGNGSFQIDLDPGAYNVSARPPEGSGFPWSIHPNVSVGAGSDPLNVQVPYAIPVDGIVTDAGGQAVRNAILRAYAPLPDGSGTIQVGETRTDETGHYLLLLPPGFGP
jgi:hypothetical protein